MAIIDWANRTVLVWRRSNTRDGTFCLEALKGTFQRNGKRRILNPNQDTQITSTAFTAKLEAAGVTISMDSRGRIMDNIFIERM